MILSDILQLWSAHKASQLCMWQLSVVDKGFGGHCSAS